MAKIRQYNLEIRQSMFNIMATCFHRIRISSLSLGKRNRTTSYVTNLSCNYSEETLNGYVVILCPSHVTDCSTECQHSPNHSPKHITE
ncbi:hypothetical protein EB796_023862 [Bugula neritina]|uniref:Uncharacterized protein n=1 Tax=Bugula neritina TaxID=10212 RepID=A0A7J7IX60_BUGNE|nr:hypothetical protein EB796_023862 [Bugula neritina]